MASGTFFSQRLALFLLLAFGYVQMFKILEKEKAVKIGDLVIRKIPMRGTGRSAPALEQRRRLGPTESLRRLRVHLCCLERGCSLLQLLSARLGEVICRNTQLA